VWTTNAQFSAYGLLLARTDADVPKHKGLTMFVVPMDAEGVTVRGLRQITGDAEFNEVFFDDVKLDADAVVGGVGNGWGTALTTLMFERLTIGFGSEGLGYRPERFAERVGQDPAARATARCASASATWRPSCSRSSSTATGCCPSCSRARSPGPEAGLAKITTVNAGIAACDLVADVVGPDALDESGENPFVYHTSFLPGLKSAGGTEEILRNTIGERVLGLPPEPRLDKGIPFSELRAKEKEAAAR
jgi:alkylation response protein AidB-like acyl-CoA dehydrogenase